MATYKVRHKPGNYSTDPEIANVLNYADRHGKIKRDRIYGGALLPEIAVLSMEGVTSAYHNHRGIHLRHSILSFSPEEPISIEDAVEIEKQAAGYYEDDYQIFAAVHTDEPHIHIHFVMNTTNYNTGTKYRGKKKDLYSFQHHLESILKPHGVFVELVK